MGKSKHLRSARQKVRVIANRVIEKPLHADRWPLEFLPWIGRIIRRRRIKKNAEREKMYKNALKYAVKKQSKVLTNV